MVVIHAQPRARAQRKPCTTFAGGINIFTGENMSKAKTQQKPVNTTALEICDDPMPAGRAPTVNKYEDLFKAMKPGQCIKCESGEAAKIANALRKHFEVHKQNYLVRSTERYPTDGKGRVWKLEKPAKSKA